MSQIDSGISDYTWGVDPYDQIYLYSRGKLRKVAGSLVHVSSGASGVFGISRSRSVWFRRGVTKRRRHGKSWKRVGGTLSQVDSGPYGIVCGVHHKFSIYCRTGISKRRPYGRKWTRVPGKLMYISCGLYGHWGVNKGQAIYFRRGVSRGRPQGTKWQRVPGKLVQIESGSNGAVFGVNIMGKVYTRLGITRRNPVGRRWKVVGKKKLSSISVGRGILYGIGRKGQALSGDPKKFLGKRAIPRKPCKFFIVFLEGSIKTDHAKPLGYSSYHFITILFTIIVFLYFLLQLPSQNDQSQVTEYF